MSWKMTSLRGGVDRHWSPVFSISSRRMLMREDWQGAPAMAFSPSDRDRILCHTWGT